VQYAVTAAFRSDVLMKESYFSAAFTGVVDQGANTRVAWNADAIDSFIALIVIVACKWNEITCVTDTLYLIC
jgi:hypothetical protein